MTATHLLESRPALGSPLSATDLDHLARSGIDADWAERALLRRVDSATGGQMVGRNGSGDYTGILIPNLWPGDDHAREYRLRLDHPEMEWSESLGGYKPRAKYLSPPGRGNLLYLVPGTDESWLKDSGLPIVIVEGEKKAIAASALAWLKVGDAGDRPSRLTVALTGVWSWRGKVGRTEAPGGGWSPVKGVIADFDKIVWQGRQVSILFDANVSTNESVRAARSALAKELRSRGAVVRFVDIPADAGVNGVDDLVGKWGRDRVLAHIETTAYDPTAQSESNARDLLNHLYNDHGNASRLIALYGDDLRYCHALKKWLVWDGRRWAVDDTGHARRLAKNTIIEFLKQASDATASDAEKFARSSLDHRRIISMLQMAESEIFVRPEELDRDPDLLNFTNGTVDLRSNELRSHRPGDFITKLIHHNFDRDADCPRWLAFLGQVMGGDSGAQRMVDYLQRAIGYSLTGRTSEKAVFVPFGGGDNGKSTMLTTIRQLVEEYAVILQVDTLMVRQESNNTQADLADLRGARFVQTSETEDGQRLAQGKLKRITQGMGTIKAVRKYENPIEFQETHKLWMDTNRKPGIRDADDAATFNRLHPIPFTVRIPKDRIDRSLPEKLIAEGEGILAWAVAGAKLWYESGLNQPPAIKAANEQWRSEMDRLTAFLDDCCVIGDAFTVQAASLFAAYRRWCDENEEKTLSANEFARKLGDKGFNKRHTQSGKRYSGIALRMTDG